MRNLLTLLLLSFSLFAQTYPSPTTPPNYFTYQYAASCYPSWCGAQISTDQQLDVYSNASSCAIYSTSNYVNIVTTCEALNASAYPVLFVLRTRPISSSFCSSSYFGTTSVPGGATNADQMAFWYSPYDALATVSPTHEWSNAFVREYYYAFQITSPMYGQLLGVQAMRLDPNDSLVYVSDDFLIGFS